MIPRLDYDKGRIGERTSSREVIRSIGFDQGDQLIAERSGDDSEAVLEVLEVMRCVLFYMLDAVDGGLCLLEVLEVPMVMRRVLSYSV